jgi:hypothetical protein
MVNLDMGLHINSNLDNSVIESTIKSVEKVPNNFINFEEPLKHSNNICNSIKCKINCYNSVHVSESDQSEKEIGK